MPHVTLGVPIKMPAFMRYSPGVELKGNFEAIGTFNQETGEFTFRRPGEATFSLRHGGQTYTWRVTCTDSTPPAVEAPSPSRKRKASKPNKNKPATRLFGEEGF